MSRTFAVTWDYRCPFARNVHEHLLVGLRAAADWQVAFVPFSLGQVHVAEGEPSVWEKPEQDSGLLALQVGTVVRDEHPDAFPDVHRRLFAARHDEGRHLDEPAVLRAVLNESGVDAEAVFARIDSGAALETVRSEHEGAANEHNVWGVPTFLVDGQAVYIRLMNRPAPDGPSAASVHTIEQVVDLAGGWPDLNEFKHTSLPR